MEITNVVLLVVTISALSFANSKQLKPRQDEIERVVNDTYSYIWKCSLVECPFGYGLNVPCGSRIPFNVSIHCVLCDEGVSYSDTHDFSQCKMCTNCDPHEERSGWCSLEEDTITCLRTCHKGFYWDNLTDSCHPCSKCCGHIDTSHEKQCEGSGLPITHQCQQTNIVCPDPTTDSSSDVRTFGPQDQLSSDNPEQRTLSSLEIGDSDNRTLGPQDQSSWDNPERRALSSLEITIIVIFTIILIIFMLVIIALVWMWRKFGWQTTKTKLGNWFCCCWGSETSNGGKTVHFHNNTWREEEAKIESLQSAPSVVKRPAFLRLFSVPIQSQLTNKVKPAIARSHSHPGCLKDLTKEPAKDKPGSPKKCGSNRRTKKLGKKVYSSLAMLDQDQELPDVIDHNAAGVGSPELIVLRAEPELIITNQDPAEERDKESSITNLNPPSFPMKTQSTSTTGLHHLSSTSISSVPEDFKTDLLKRRMSSIPIMFYSDICIKLDMSRGCFWDDHRSFGEKIGLSKDEIFFLRQKEDTTHSMIQKFNSQMESSIGRFREIVESMKRDDVASVIDEWIVYEWNARCSSSVVKL